MGWLCPNCGAENPYSRTGCMACGARSSLLYRGRERICSCMERLPAFRRTVVPESGAAEMPRHDYQKVAAVLNRTAGICMLLLILAYFAFTGWQMAGGTSIIKWGTGPGQWAKIADGAGKAAGRAGPSSRKLQMVAGHFPAMGQIYWNHLTKTVKNASWSSRQQLLSQGFQNVLQGGAPRTEAISVGLGTGRPVQESFSGLAAVWERQRYQASWKAQLFAQRARTFTLHDLFFWEKFR